MKVHKIPQRFITLAVLAIFTIIGNFHAISPRIVSAALTDTAVYNNDFEGAVGAEWLNTSIFTSPVTSRKLLGRFGNQTMTLSLGELAAHDSMKVKFDVYAIRSWDGNGDSPTPTPTSTPAACDTLQQGLIAWYRAEDNSLDSIGSNHGSLENGTAFGAGQAGQGFLFDGANDYVNVPHSSSLNPSGSFTLDAWINLTQDGDGAIVSKWGDEGSYSNQRAYVLHYVSGGRLVFGISDDAHQSDGVFHTFLSPINVVTLNAWNYVAAVYDQTTGTRRIYVNGAQVAERTDAPITITNSIADLNIGTWKRAPGSALRHFNGVIDEVGIYGRALSAEEIAALYAAGGDRECGDTCEAITLNPSSLQDGTVGEEYSQVLTPTGAAGPFTFAVTNGSLVDGLTLDPSLGVISGIPTTVETATFTVTATDANSGCTGSQDYTVNVGPPPDLTPPAITPIVTGTLGNNSWFISNVGVSFVTVDNESAINERSGCDAQSISADTAGTTFTCTATSSGGTASSSVTIKRDATSPSISLNSRTPANGYGWNNTDVVVTWNCSDAMSGPLNLSAGQTKSGQGQNQSAIGICQDNAGNVAYNTQIGINIDKTVPTLAPTVAPNSVPVGGSATASANASDVLSGIAAQSCGTVDTSTAGSKTVNCSATDKAGNSANANASYTVGAYNFRGFFQPVDNLPILNEVAAGQAIPVKFSLNGYQGLDIFATGFPASAVVSCGSSTYVDAIEETVNAGGSSLKYDPTTDYYNYIWKTDRNWKGTCRVLLVRLKDGNTYSASFKFK